MKNKKEKKDLLANVTKKYKKALKEYNIRFPKVEKKVRSINMYTYKKEKGVPVKIWSQEGSIEQKALEQIENTANLPFAFHHVALMPDGHVGYGMPIGGIVALYGAVSPNMVGVDIGCGMCAVKTSLKEISQDTLKKIMGEIREQIPLGFNHHKEKQDHSLMPKNLGVEWGDDEVGLMVSKVMPICVREYQNALTQIGTLGGGNHFIEIQKGSDGHIWIMVHSGSRNIGLKVAEYYNKLAVKLNEQWYSGVPKSWELAFLPLDSDEGQMYMDEMNYCVEFALANRKLMMDNITKIVADRTQSTFEPMINIAHNYARLENHFGKNVMIHRKGATLATPETVGIIPGSQGTKSYIVKGKGNPDSFMSCSHGAGRKMGRKVAQKTLNLEEEIKKLNDMGVIHAIRGEKDLDEAPGSYKDIQTVMDNQKDLVNIMVELTPLAVIKG